MGGAFENRESVIVAICWMPTRANKRFYFYLFGSDGVINTPAAIPNRCSPRWQKPSLSAALAGAQLEIGQSHLFV